MKKIQPLNILYFFSLLLAITSCRKEDACTNVQRGNSAAAKINASERLTIPVAVALPDNAPKGNIRVATYYAEGVQKYKASPKAGDPGKFEWVFVAPDALLYDINNVKVGTHGAGPYWQLTSADLIYAQHFSPARTSASPDAESIDWLLLKTKTGTTPTGIFAGVDYIQRIATKGGKAPQTAPEKVTDSVAVKYQAVYRFSRVVQ
ncbi:DUF3455 domain-containing protein [Segetibacter sp. 3557_3]|uniref:DUF3455 domain-containing protein n=1 Tax=Segetibacter sp. 3557_3 TaxID=2547429 RepID=UPI001058CC66|nr:DUF3455 domain-containing protein [Segetibacter sp. 3557_3]TDH24663.1 DUF3455 domain-containing protein [Segetibacter sp. 3557_3]